MKGKCRYGFGKIVPLSFEAAVVRVTNQLQARGFKILSRIDLKQHLEETTGIKFRRYLILGACKADFAVRAFSADPNIGLLLPCNVVVYETDEGKIRVMAMDPVHIMDLVNQPQAIEVAMELKETFEEVMGQL